MSRAAADAFERVQDATGAAIDPALLELVRLRMATLLGDAVALAARSAAATAAGLTEAKIALLPAWPTAPEFTDLERDVLSLAEQFVMDVSGVDDAMVDALAAHLPAGDVYATVQALYVIDQSLRFDAVVRQLAP